MNGKTVIFMAPDPVFPVLVPHPSTVMLYEEFVATKAVANLFGYVSNAQ